MDLSNINWLAVLVAALSTFILGGLWYGPLFGRTWMRASGMTEERVNGAGSHPWHLSPIARRTMHT